MFKAIFGKASSPQTQTMSKYAVSKPDSEWRTILSKEQFRVVREKGTEAPGTGEYNHHTGQGVYQCVGCQAPLFTSKHKFDSGCGWPAFFDSIPGMQYIQVVI